jgi:CheY-like chemotaxis protein
LPLQTIDYMGMYRLLVVDDEQDIILPLHYLFQENGFEVVSFSDPLLALERFKPRYYDLLILDIKMPQMNGFELYRDKKEGQRHESVFSDST